MLWRRIEPSDKLISPVPSLLLQCDDLPTNCKHNALYSALTLFVGTTRAKVSSWCSAPLRRTSGASIVRASGTESRSLSLALPHPGEEVCVLAFFELTQNNLDPNERDAIWLMERIGRGYFGTSRQWGGVIVGTGPTGGRESTRHRRQGRGSVGSAATTIGQGCRGERTEETFGSVAR